MDYQKIKTSIEAGKFVPVYYLFGEEPYYIDKITHLLEEKVLDEGLKSFNQEIVYGSDMTGGKLNGLLRSFPVMSNYRLVIMKEAQKMKKTEWDQLITYIEKPLNSTIFVIAFKDKKMDGRSKLGKLLKDGKDIITLESKKLYENQVPAFLNQVLAQFELTADEQAISLLVDSYGNNLSLIEKEIEKLSIQLKFLKKKKITTDFIYEYVNIDRDFNVFELQDSIGQKNLYKSWQIMDYLTRNSKDNPAVLIMHNLFSYFNRLAICKFRRADDEKEIAALLGIHPFIAKNYRPGLRNYSMLRIKENLIHIADADLRLKGVRTSYMGDEHTLKTLLHQLVR
jgi:DNA polymerase III subunit delta